MTIEVETVARWAGLIALALSIANTLWAMLMSGARENAGRIAELEKKLTDHDRRIQHTESGLAHAPTRREFEQIKISVAKIEVAIERLQQQIGALSQTLTRIDDYLRDRS